ncbi:MAG: hypothetical protein GF313_05370 [Caldithrix sp.]|nr:hypothetical protein [Caldithrix sp.]
MKRSKHHFKRWMYPLVLILILCIPLAAQDSGAAESMTEMDTAVLKVYFFLLVFATIINRLLQYIKIIYLWLKLRIRFLNRINERIWQRVKKNLERWHIKYDEETVRPFVDKAVTAIVLHTLGLIVGIFICFSFQLSVMQFLGWLSIPAALDYTLTGLLIGLGIDPVHMAFRFAEEKKQLKHSLNRVSSKQEM